MYHLLRLEVLFGEEVGDVPCADFLLEGGELGVEVTTFEVEDTVAEMVVLNVGHFTPHPLAELAEVGDGTRDDEVEIALHLLGTDLFGTDVLQLQLLGHVLHHLDFLPYRVDKIKLGIGEHDGQGDAGEPAAGTHIEYLGHGFERLHLGDGKAVKDMVLVEVVHVFARDDIDFGVPVLIQRQKGGKLFLLPLGELWEVFVYQLYACHRLKVCLQMFALAADAESLDAFFLDLADTLAGEAELHGYLVETESVRETDAEVHLDDLTFVFGEG